MLIKTPLSRIFTPELGQDISLGLLEGSSIPRALCGLKASSKGAAAGRHMNHEITMLQFTDPKAGTGLQPRKLRRSFAASP
jgi:hypothetical protein